MDTGISWKYLGKEYWTAPSILDSFQPHFEADSNASGLTPPR